MRFRNNRHAGRARRGLTILLSALLLSHALAARAGEAHDANTEELQLLRSRLKELERSLEQTRGERDSLRSELRAVESEAGALLKSLHELARRQRAASARLASLERDRQRERRRLADQGAELETQMRAAYVMGRQEYLKLLLNQQDPARVSRMLTYYRYLNTARAERIGAIRASLSQLNVLEDQVRQRTRELDALRDDQLREQRALEQTRAQRTEVLARLNREVVSQSQEIEQLRRDEQQLTKLVSKLRNVFADAPPALRPDQDTRFRDARGRLRLPVHGRITARYGSPKNIGDLRWDGVFLSAREGQEVRAVFHGRVAYSDWLRGYGLLMILEHGDGYMTLYGHNQSLYKGVGDWVDAGELIASTGSTGGPPAPGVYFEVRHNGKPRDPLEWCKLGR